MNNNNNNNGQRASFAFFAHTTITTDGKGKSSLFSFLFSSNKILQLAIGRKSTKESKKSESSARALKTVFRGQIPTERDTETRRRSMSSQKTRSFSAPRVPSRKTPPPVLKAGKTSTTQTVSFSNCALAQLNHHQKPKNVKKTIETRRSKQLSTTHPMTTTKAFLLYFFFFASPLRQKGLALFVSGANK